VQKCVANSVQSGRTATFRCKLVRFAGLFKTVASALCCSILVAPPFALAQDKQAGVHFGKDKLLTPIIIDEKYLQRAIPAQGSQGTLTLREAVEEAALSNRDVRKASLEVSRFRWDYWAVESSRLPNFRCLGYLAEQTVTQQSPLVPARPNSFLFMSALFPVTQQYRYGLEASVVKLAREIAAQKLRQQLDETRARVKEAYYELALDKSLIDDVEDSIVYLSDLEKTVHDQVTRGNSLKVEEMEVAARLGKARFEETKARNKYTVDREQFNHLLGRSLDSNVQLELIPSAAEIEIDVKKAEQTALSMRPEIQEADFRVKQLKTETKVIMSEYIPNVSVGAVYISLPGFNNTIIPKNLFAPGIFINWNAFDWGRKAMLAKARSKVEKEATLTAQSTREQVLIDLHKQINRLRESHQLVQTSQLSRGAARERLRVSANRYKYTEEKLADVLQAQSKLADENKDYHQALLAFWQAKAELDRAVGTEQ
jgi:outer membrane protein TolC